MDRKRLLLALALSVAVLMGYSFIMNRFFPPPPAVQEPLLTPGPQQPAASSPKPQASTAAPATPAKGVAAPVTGTLAPVTQAAQTQVPQTQVPPRDMVITTDFWQVTLTNRGAVATSWILDAYRDNGVLKQIKGAGDGPLQLVPQPIPEYLDAPLALLLPDQPELAAQFKQTNYQIKIDGADPSQNEIKINAGEQRKITFTATNGTATVTKEFTFYGDRLICDARASLTTSEGERPVQLVIGPGIGDQSDKSSGSYSTPPQVVAYTTQGSREQLAGAKINEPLATIQAVNYDDKKLTLDKPLNSSISYIKITAEKGASFIGYARVVEGQGSALVTLDAVPQGAAAGQSVAPRFDILHRDYQWAGVADHYFAMLAIPDQPAREIALENVQLKQDDPNHPLHDYLAVGVPANVATHIFVGPKDREVLAEVGGQYNANLGAVIDYGFFGAIVRPLIYPLAWAFNFFAGLFHNYGWAIVTVTILINLALWPLRATSSKKMKQAAKHQPRLKELQERMKKLKENPKKYERELQQLQQEQLALMKEANPLGGCLPMLLQLPIFWSVYMYLGMSLDVRHAGWLGWISDLSKPDPYKILPIVMCISMIASTKFTPQPASADPAMKMQRVMMTWLMPIMLTYFFFLSAPSGLVLYWMVSNLVGVAIQLLINKQNAEPENEAGALAGGGSANQRNSQKTNTQKGGKPKGGKDRTALPSSDLS
jgi:YidC/Oxa1 family membrane protein insertase